jgi:hypothetical protein
MSEINKKEKLLLEYAITNAEAFVTCYPILKPSYFEPPLDRMVEFVQDHFKKYGTTPDVDIIEAETGIRLKERELLDNDLDYFLDEVEEHCQYKAMEEAIYESADLIAQGNRPAIHEIIKNAYLVKLDKSIGTDIFEDPEERIRRMSEHVIEYSCGIPEIDDLIGFYRRGELHLVYGVSSGGKSLWLLYQSIMLAKQNLDVYIITLELGELLYAKRADVMITQMDIRNHGKEAEEIAQRLAKEKESMGRIDIKFMHNGTTCPDIEAALLEYRLVRGKLPDVLVVDYLHLMGCTSKGLNRHDIDDEISMGLRGIATRNNLICLSGQQINREGQDVMKMNPSHVAGGISVVNNSDSSIYFAATEEDLDNNQVNVGAMKQRNSTKTGKQIVLYRCPKSLRFSTTPFIGKVEKKEEGKSSLTDREKLRNVLKMKK